MDKTTKRLVILIIILLTINIFILICVVNEKPDYNKELYEEIYSEYNEIFEEDKISDTTKNSDSNENQDSKQKKDIIYIEQGIFGDEYKVIGKIGISKIDLFSPIIYETTDELMKIGPTKLCGPALNEVGNVCIIGHNYRNDQFFSNLSNLEMDDEIIIINNRKEKLTYKVFDTYEIYEDDLNCLNQDTNGKIELTLITCTKNKKKRYVVKCRAIE